MEDNELFGLVAEVSGAQEQYELVKTFQCYRSGITNDVIQVHIELWLDRTNELWLITATNEQDGFATGPANQDLATALRCVAWDDLDSDPSKAFDVPESAV